MKDATDKQMVIVGLGNPGRQYAFTRHNMGYLAVQAFAHGQGWIFKDAPQFVSQVAKGKLEDVQLHLLLPLTYMNESGKAVKSYLDYYRLGPKQLIVVCDDIAFDFGEIRIREKGGSGGHKGLRSIQDQLHTQEYTRVRMGIGLDRPEQQTLADYVLDAFSPTEKEELPAVLDSGVNLLRRLVHEEVTTVMNQVNSKQNEKTSDEG